MKQTDKTLLEQMRITDFEIESRKQLFSLCNKDIEALRKVKPIVQLRLDNLIDDFYEVQTNIPEIALLIGDSETLNRLVKFQHKYILDLFSGVYDLDYVNYRLRIGLVHKRIGVESKLYLSAMFILKSLLIKILNEEVEQEDELARVTEALVKVLLFDISLVFDAYIRSMLTEIEMSKQKSEQYAEELEEKIMERTQQLEELSRTDPLTGLLNTRHLKEIFTKAIRAAERREEPISMVYIDVNDFKIVNDSEGHQRGDEILMFIGKSMKECSRLEDSCFRYGGDEFCIILPNCTEVNALNIYIPRLMKYIKKSEPDLSLSFGVAQTGPNQYLEPEVLISQADERMYHEKRKSKSKAAIMNTAPHINGSAQV